MVTRPFLTDDDPTPYKTREAFWEAISQVPDLLGALSVFDPDADLESYGYEPGEQPKVPLYPPRRKNPELAKGDNAGAVAMLRDFTDHYDEMVTNLARARATVDLIVAHHGYEL